MATSNLNVQVDYFDEIIYQEIKEAELEMSNSSKRYSKEEILESMNIIIGQLCV